MPSPHEELKQRLTDFADFAAKLKGDEKGEAQSFLDQFFRALGHKSAIEAGATFEFRVAKKPGSAQLELLTGPDAAHAKGGKKFADLLWPSRVLIEMKSRTAKLEKHYDQLFDYWSHIVPHRPPYAILCNFDEFWIYDFNQQLFDPVDKIPITKLAENKAALGFLLPYAQTPVFDNDRVAVTRKAADAFANVFKKLIARGVPREQAQRFILQLLVALVAQDLALLPEKIVTDILRDSAERPADSYDLLGGLFAQMATAKAASGGRYEHVQYFNGGLYSAAEPLALRAAEAHELHDAAKHFEWDKVKPEVFGTIFQQSLGEKERHAFGAHFTSEFDIEKVVTPTITRPWRARILAAGKSLPQLRAVLADLRKFRVLDPACGSGNFLFVAYREVKRLERQLLVALRDAGEKADKLVSAISLENFFGLDVVPFAVELAKVTLMLAKELELREAAKTEETDHLHLPENPLPLDNLDKQILCADALFTKWPKADAIIGNPPYQAKNKMQKEFGVGYMKKVRQAHPAIPGRADFCVYGLRKTHDHLEKGGHAGLVGTNTIRQNYSREGGLDYIVANGGTIHDAVSTQVWSGEAAVHVSIVNWVKDAGGSLTPPFKLIFQRGDAEDSPWESYEVDLINSSLSIGFDVASATRLAANMKSGACYQGQTHGHKGFLLDATTARQIKRANSRNGQVVFPYLTADEMLGNVVGEPARYVIDFHPRDIIDSSAYVEPYRIVKATVLPARQKAADEEKERNKPVLDAKPEAKVNHHHANFLKQWWLLSYARGELIERVSHIPRYVACGQVTKRPIFEFVSAKIRPNAALTVFPLADDYCFGILQSGLHFEWFKARCSTLKGDFRYTSDTVFDTFPWPQAPAKKALRTVADAAAELRKLRRERMAQLGWSLRELYRTLDEPGASPLKDAHAALDAAVRTAYGMAATDDPLSFLLSLNAECAAAEKAGKPITPPGLPLPPAEHAAYITEDCIPAPKL